MKNMNMKERYWTMNLQIFAGDGGDDDSGEEGEMMIRMIQETTMTTVTMMR